MNLKCFTVMVLFASVVAVPVQPISNLTHRSSHNPPMSHPPHTLRPVVPISPQSHNQTSQTYRILTQALSGKTPATLRSHRQQSGQDTQSKNASLRSAPTPAEKKVEEFAKKLRADMEASERVLNVFIKTIKDKHTNAQSKLKRANENLSNIKKLILKYKNEIVNATKYEDKYQSDETAQSKQSSLLSGEYQKAKKMYDDEAANIRFEKQFLEQIIKYIQLRKTQKC